MKSVVYQTLVLSMALVFVLHISGCGDNPKVPSDDELIQIYQSHRTSLHTAAQSFISGYHSKVARKPSGRIFVDSKPSNPDIVSRYEGLMASADLYLIRQIDISAILNGIAFVFYVDGMVSSGGCEKGLLFMPSGADLPSSGALNDACSFDMKARGDIGFSYRKIDKDWYVYSQLN